MTRRETAFTLAFITLTAPLVLVGIGVSDTPFADPLDAAWAVFALGCVIIGIAGLAGTAWRTGRGRGISREGLRDAERTQK